MHSRFFNRVHALFQNVGFRRLFWDGGNHGRTQAATASALVVLIEKIVHFRFEFNVLEFDMLNLIFFFNSMVHCCYDFRLKMLERLIENSVHFRFELNVLEFDWLNFSIYLTCSPMLFCCWGFHFEIITKFAVGACPQCYASPSVCTA